MKGKVVVIGVIAVVGLLIAPFSVAAATNTEIIAIMEAVLTGVLGAGKDAYCAAGIAAFCP